LIQDIKITVLIFFDTFQGKRLVVRAFLPCHSITIKPYTYEEMKKEFCRHTVIFLDIIIEKREFVKHSGNVEKSPMIRAFNIVISY